MRRRVPKKPAAAALDYLCSGLNTRPNELEPAEMFVGAVQIASALKVVSLPLVLFIETAHSSGDEPVDELIPELLTVTAVLSDGVNAPPPVTTIPAGQSTNASCWVPFGNGVSGDAT